MGSSDIQVIFPLFIFVLLVGILSTFFYFNDSNALSLREPDIGNETPDSDIMNYSAYMEGYSGGAGIDTLTGIGLMVLGGALIILTAGAAIPLGVASGLTALALLGAGGGVTIYGGVRTLQGVVGKQAVYGLPVIGDITKGLDSVSTALGAFINMFSWSIGALEPYPYVLAVIVAPIVFVVFMVMIRFIRGQG